LVLKVLISNVVSEQRKLYDCDKLGHIASEIQVNAYYKNIIFIANKYAN